MPAIIAVLGIAYDFYPAPLYLVDSDVDGHGGRGSATFADRPEKAKQFPDKGEALAYWQRQSTVQPLRDDGKPNRPLTAYTIEIVDAQP